MASILFHLRRQKSLHTAGHSHAPTSAASAAHELRHHVLHIGIGEHGRGHVHECRVVQHGGHVAEIAQTAGAAEGNVDVSWKERRETLKFDSQS